MRKIIGLALIAAGSLKLSDRWALAQVVDDYRLVGKSWVGLTAIILPWAEVLTELVS